LSRHHPRKCIGEGGEKKTIVLRMALKGCEGTIGDSKGVQRKDLGKTTSESGS